MKISQREKVFILILVIALLSVVFFNYVYSPLKDETEKLQATNISLNSELNVFNSKFANVNIIDQALINAKIQAIDLSATMVSGNSVAALAKRLNGELLKINNPNGSTTELSYTSPTGDSSARFIYTDGLKKLNVKVPRESGVGEINYELYYTTLTLSFAPYQNGLNGLNDVNTLLDKIENEYKFMIIQFMRLTAPAETTGNSISSRYSVNMTIDIFMANGNYNDYLLGNCPHINDNGSVCGAYNEFHSTTCIECGKAIDDCPNPNCNTILPLNATQCHVCQSLLENCPYCEELIIEGSTFCYKCSRNLN